jgi:hypothetical protein
MPDDTRWRRDPRREPEEHRSERVSSNDLLLEEMRQFLESRRRDIEDGITIRALNRQMTEHTEADETRHKELDARLRDWYKELDARLRELGEANAKHTGQMETGRFQLPPPGQVPIIISSNGGKSKRPSHPFLAGMFDDPKRIVALIGALTVLAHALLRLLH